MKLTPPQPRIQEVRVIVLQEPVDHHTSDRALDKPPSSAHRQLSFEIPPLLWKSTAFDRIAALCVRMIRARSVRIAPQV
jgi:hypothetical protein